MSIPPFITGWASAFIAFNADGDYLIKKYKDMEELT